jgi:hypothetical protein
MAPDCLQNVDIFPSWAFSANPEKNLRPKGDRRDPKTYFYKNGGSWFKSKAFSAIMVMVKLKFAGKFTADPCRRLNLG